MQFKRPSSSVLRIDFENNIISEASTHNDAHTTPSMSCHAAHTAMTAAFGDIATATSPATLADAQDAIPGLLDHVVVTHILRSEHFDDPADLARLPAVSRLMRDAVASTGFSLKSLTKSVPCSSDV